MIPDTDQVQKQMMFIRHSYVTAPFMRTPSCFKRYLTQGCKVLLFMLGVANCMIGIIYIYIINDNDHMYLPVYIYIYIHT